MSIILKNKATEKLYLNEKLADVHFAFNINDEVHKVPANKANLAALSPVFDRMFYGSLPEQGDVKIVDASVEAFKEFLQLFYLGEVNLTIRNFDVVHCLADKYDILEHLNNCTSSTESELTTENACWGLQFALFSGNQTLTEYCEEKIRRAANEAFASDAFRRCDKETLKHILKMNLPCESIDVFNACIDWAKHACIQNGLDENQVINLRNQLGDNLKLIRYEEMSVKEFTNMHVKYIGLFALDEFEDIMLTLTMDGYTPKIFNRNPRQLWMELKLTECQRVIHNVGPYKWHEVEVLSFTSNQPIFLTQFDCLRTDPEYIIIFPVKVVIAQVQFECFEISKNLYTEEHNISDDSIVTTINLKKQIFIKPNTMYEIRITQFN